MIEEWVVSEHQRMAAFGSTWLSTSSEVAFGKFWQILWVNHPVVSFAVLSPTGLHETVITGQIMSHTISPARALFLVKVRIVAGDEAVDGT